jgi:hypothetical protein
MRTGSNCLSLILYVSSTGWEKTGLYHLPVARREGLLFTQQILHSSSLPPPFVLPPFLLPSSSLRASLTIPHSVPPRLSPALRLALRLGTFIRFFYFIFFIHSALGYTRLFYLLVD